MQIVEVVLKNFGKFQERKIEFTDGINLIYGENESGKSTVHTFLKGMLFGIQKARGRAVMSESDIFGRCEPWENPSFYAGSMVFSCGGRTFRLERRFDKSAKSASLFCEDDGEELSLKHGDLDVLLGGMTEADYENTVSVGQMKAQAGESLAAELQNYAANYYTAGSSDIDLEGALNHLKEKKKALEREIRSQEKERQARREQIGQEASYIWREMHRLEKEIEENEEEQKALEEEWQKCEDKRKQELRKEEQEGFFYGWRIHPVEIFSMAAAFVLSLLLFEKPWNFLVAIVVALAEGLYIWNCLKDGKKKKAARKKAAQEEWQGLREALDKKKWSLERLRSDYREKQIEYENLKEQLGELDELGGEYQKQEEGRQALDLAEKTMLEVSREMQAGVGQKLNARISEILCEVTDGKYEKVWADEKLHIHLLSDGRRISMEQTSRGTIEQIYFALRMASSEVLQEEEFPVILDDTFAYYDDKRMELALKWLSRSRGQVLLFTCQKREMETLEKMGARYHRIVL